MNWEKHIVTHPIYPSNKGSYELYHIKIKEPVNFSRDHNIYLNRWSTPLLEPKESEEKRVQKSPICESEMKRTSWTTVTVRVGTITVTCLTPWRGFTILSTSAASVAQHIPNTSKLLLLIFSAIFFSTMSFKMKNQKKKKKRA